ncbi:MAG: hypothetical protein M0R03_03675 [Novosphingobium sp.]|nr:hypothetical protein [Novosphingobium sp.]
MKNKSFIFFTILLIFALNINATESFTYISGNDSIRDFPPIFNADIQILAGRRYENTSAPTINNDGVDTAGEGRTFDVGNLWLNTSSGQYYICIDNSTGASVWKIITLSASDIKTLYESNADTNAFTDALLSKVNSTEIFTSAEKTKLGTISDNSNWVEDSATNGNILIDSVETTVYDDSNVVKLTGDQAIGGTKTFSDSIAVDTINEKTSANGVTIDGVQLKDGGGVFSGNVGIGTTPLEKFHIDGGNDGRSLLITRNSDAGIILFEKQSNVLKGWKIKSTDGSFALQNVETTYGNIVKSRFSISSDGIVSIPNQSSCDIEKSSAQTLTNTIGANIANYTSTLDNTNVILNMTNGTITIDEAGTYFVSAVVVFDINATGGRMANIRKNGSATNLIQRVQAIPTYGTYINLSGIVKCSVGDTLIVQATQYSGGDLDVIFAKFQVVKIK